MANFDLAKAIFSQVDANSDGRIDPNEFRNWVSQNASAGASSASAFESSSFQSSVSGAEGGAGFAFAGNAGGAGFEGATGYEASFSSQSGFESAAGAGAGASVVTADAGANALAIGGVSGAFSTSSAEFAQSGAATIAESTSVEQTTKITSAAGIFQDPNPQVIRRAATTGPVTYQQKILVRFLQPPAVPPPGPLIIKEVRPPQPPPPPPLVVRQRAPPLPQPAPLILRERPPVPPAAVASQTVIRRLEAIPVPPRSVIIERLPALPPKPRDIIIERWVPYGAQAKRRTIVQRAAAAKEYPKPRNIIIVYDAVQARIVRQFQRLGVVQENPQAYVTRYGASLLDASILLQQARAAGVIEDISPPNVAVAAGAADAQFSASSSSSSFGGNAGFEFASGSAGEAAGFSGAESASFGGVELVGGDAAAAASSAEGFSSQSFSSSSGFGVGGGLGGFNIANAIFNSADTNRDGKIDQAEFQRFVQGAR